MKTPTNQLIVTTVTLSFKGIETVKEIYKMHIKEVKETVLMLDEGNFDALVKAEMEIKELLAIVQNKQARNKGLKLAKTEDDDTRPMF